MDHYAVMGNPIQHSLSPLIHQFFAEQTQQVLQYQAIHVPLGELPKALDHFQNNHGKGVNITLPFKQDAFYLVNHCSDRARQAKAINTILFNEDGTRSGDNTDGFGLIKDICVNYQYAIPEKRILILGAGGAVRGIIGPLLEQKPDHLVIANRTQDKAAQLAKEFHDLGEIQACALNELAHLGSFDFIIHATSWGLHQEYLVLPKTLLTPATFCYDLGYGDQLTPFLRWAEQQGVSFLSNGWGMLVEQAAESFYVWRNIKPDTKKLRATQGIKVYISNIEHSA